MKKENFKLTGYNQKPILGDITFSENSKDNFAIFVHGFKGFKDWGAHNLVARYFAKHGINYVKFNFSHSGVPVENPVDVTDLTNFANNTPVKELYDLKIVIDYITGEYGNPKITLIGHSRGGGISILQGEKDKRINALITWAAIDDFSSLWKKEQEEEWHKKGKIETFNARTKEYMPLNLVLLEDFEQNRELLDIKRAARDLKKPWLVFHGDEDINVKQEVAKTFKEINSKAELVIINGANHVFGASHPYTEEKLPGLLEAVCEKSVSFILKTSEV